MRCWWGCCGVGIVALSWLWCDVVFANSFHSHQFAGGRPVCAVLRWLCYVGWLRWLCCVVLGFIVGPVIRINAVGQFSSSSGHHFSSLADRIVRTQSGLYVDRSEIHKQLPLHHHPIQSSCQLNLQLNQRNAFCIIVQLNHPE